MNTAKRVSVVALGKRYFEVSLLSHLQSVPFAPGVLIPSQLLWDCPTSTATLDSGSTDILSPCGSLRFLDFSFPARCLQPPRGARRMQVSIASSSVTDFSISGRLVTPNKRNEAEASSLALRLAGSRGEASACSGHELAELGDYSFHCSLCYMLDTWLT